MSGTENPSVTSGTDQVPGATEAWAPAVDPHAFDGMGVFNTENPPTADGASLVKGATDQPEPEPDGLTAQDAAPLVEKEVG